MANSFQLYVMQKLNLTHVLMGTKVKSRHYNSNGKYGTLYVQAELRLFYIEGICNVLEEWGYHVGL